MQFLFHFEDIYFYAHFWLVGMKIYQRKSRNKAIMKNEHLSQSFFYFSNFFSQQKNKTDGKKKTQKFVYKQKIFCYKITESVFES